MSALHPKADMCGAIVDVRFGPIADMLRLLDHLVGNLLEVQRYFSAQCLGSLEVDDKFKLSWPHDWQVSWLRTLKYFSNVNTSLVIR